LPPKRHQAPSRARYAAAHPARTVRFKPETHAKIVAICERTGLSYNQAVNSAIDGLDEAAIEVIRARGEELGFRKGVLAARPPARAAGFAAAADVFRLTVPCSICGQPIELRNGSDDARELLKLCVDHDLERFKCPPGPASLQSLTPS
jgi:hypothetical protein